MPAPPARNEISDTFPNPSNAVARIGNGKFWDYVVGLLGQTGSASDARSALGISTGLDIYWNNPGYYTFPVWQDGLMFQMGMISAVTDGIGAVSVSFPKGFPHNLLSVTVSNGYSSPYGHPRIHTVDNFALYAQFTSGSANIGPGVAVQLNYIAIGR